MQPKTIIFFGPSGSGKGTQAELLSKALTNSGHSVKTFSVGSAIREFAKGTGLINKKIRDLIDDGNLVPTFFPTYSWSNFFLNEVTASDDVVLEGIRRKPEIILFESLLQLLDRKCHVIVLEISSDVATERLLVRTRHDDGAEEISRRMDWYASEVLPAITYADASDQFDLLRINGENSINDIHNEIKAKLGLE